MRYIKVYDADGTVVAAEQLPIPVFVRWHSRNRRMLICSEYRAQGVLSANGATAYQLEGREEMGEARALSAAFIDQGEYDVLAAELMGTTEPPDTETEDATQEPEGVTTLSQAEMYLRLKELESNMAAVKTVLDTLKTILGVRE